MICDRVLWWVHPTAYASALVRSRPLLRVSASATCRNWGGSMPQTSCTISGV